ncbi:MAG: dihydropteroate synthase [Spirochaetales bacterium]|nr:dihydropteroate synthase [Spirochaetales bacterium]
MAKSSFIAVGENIHCTRIYKVGGNFVKALDDGRQVIAYTDGGKEKHMPVPAKYLESSDWASGKLKHAAAAMWQGMYGSGKDQEAGIEYLHYMAKVQEAHGACYLDVNVDEFSTDVEERRDLLSWVVGVIQEVSTKPLSIDSSNMELLQLGLKACDPGKGKPMINSVSLERQQGIELAKDAGAVVIAGAGGEKSMPTSKEERLANLERLVGLLQKAGLSMPDIHLDPLVFPVSVDPNNGVLILDTIAELRKRYGDDIHFAPGLSNISYGMPKRKLINQVFTYLCVQRGLDGGIVDPLQISQAHLDALDPASEPFKITEAFLLGHDHFGMNYISAARSGTL